MWGRMDSYCTDRRGVQRGTAFPLAGGFQRRAVPPLAHDFPSESLVCYTFVIPLLPADAGKGLTAASATWADGQWADTSRRQ